MPRFLDTNVLLRYLTNDDPAKAQQALTLLERIERGDEKVVTTILVVAETVFTLERFYKVSKQDTRNKVRDIITLSGLQLTNKSLCLAALDLHAEQNISFIDAYHAVFLQTRGISEIYTWDTHFDRLTGIVRIEPLEQDE